MPKGDRAAAGDIGYYPPNGSLVLYYQDVGYWEGIVRLGRLENQVTLIAGLPKGLQGVVERMD
ncbi:MAG: cyclophilin-like fold protein [Propionibacteriaceae bacterium]